MFENVIVFLASTIIFIGLFMVTEYIFRKSYGNSYEKMIGYIGLLLGIGIIGMFSTRAYAIIVKFKEPTIKWVGYGELVYSLVIILINVLLYEAYKRKFNKFKQIALTNTIYVLAIISIIITLLPQNGWKTGVSTYAMGIFRTIPFFIMSILVSLTIFLNAYKRANIKFQKIALFQFIANMIYFLYIFITKARLTYSFSVNFVIVCFWLYIILDVYKDVRKENELSRF